MLVSARVAGFLNDVSIRVSSSKSLGRPGLLESPALLVYAALGLAVRLQVPLVVRQLVAEPAFEVTVLYDCDEEAR